MDIITQIAEKFIKFNLGINREPVASEVIQLAREQVSDIDSHLDKIKFLRTILEGNNKAYDAHKPKCTSPDNCRINFAHDSINYFLTQELDRLGVQINEDTFTIEEKNNADAKLDKIIKDLEELKMGHEIIYDDLMKEINELKELYFLGKKNWHQLFAGKCLDMVASGIISETISKKIVATVGSSLTRLING